MISLFLGLTIFNLICLISTAALGYAVRGGSAGQWHLLAGALAAIVCVGVHCVVFTYFIATAKWIQHAATIKHLDPAVAAPTRSFKLQAFPAALLAMACVFAAAVCGAAVDNYGLDPLWHEALALGAIVVNVIVAAVEYRAIVRNGRLIDQILATIARQAAA